MKLLLFGAGASIPFFERPLTTAYITNEISNKKRWEMILNEHWKAQKEHLLTPHKIVKLINIIKASNDQANFEDICDIFDKIAYINNPYSNYKLPFQETIFMLQNCNILKKKHTKFPWVMPFVFRCVLLSIFLEVERKHSHLYKALIRKQRQFIRDYVSNDDSSIISLNYDDTIYSSVKNEYNTGFYIDEKLLNRCSFSENQFFNSKKTLSFLHGNIRFYNIHFTDINIEDVIYRLKNKYNHINDSCVHSYQTSSFNTFITTGREKELTFNESPYSAYYHKMAVDILNSDDIIIIGYSFNDKHINRLLKNYWSQNRFKRIIIVDKIDNELNIEAIERFNHAIIDNIAETFNLQINYHDKYEIDKFNKNGYGYLFPKIMIYRKGYGCFLDDYLNVICDFNYSEI